jgi:hypothetical protein
MITRVPGVLVEREGLMERLGHYVKEWPDNRLPLPLEIAVKERPIEKLPEVDCADLDWVWPDDRRRLLLRYGRRYSRFASTSNIASTFGR